MRQKNLVGYDTPRGYRVAELVHGDLGQLSPPVDVLVGSAFAGDYRPSANSVVESVFSKGVDIAALADSPALDLRDALGIWVSEPISRGPAVRFMFVEMRGGALPLKESIENVFAVLSLMEAKGASMERVAMPLLGAGSQGYPPADVIEVVVPQARAFLNRSGKCRNVTFVEKNESKVAALSKAMDVELKRRGRSISYSELAHSIGKDVINRAMEANGLFSGVEQQRADLIQTLQAKCVSPAVFSVQARKLVEQFLARSQGLDGHLYARIERLRKSGLVAPWMCAYMNVVRQLGNDGAHAGNRKFEVEHDDMVATLICLERVLVCWNSTFESQAKTRHVQ